MRGSLTVGTALAIVLTLAACEPPFEPIPEQQQRVLVHGVLDAGADTQTVMLERTVHDNFQVGIVDATVTITLPDSRVVALRRRSNEPGESFSAVPYIFLLSEEQTFLERGKIYRLDISVPEFEPISGTTTIPDTAVTTNVITHTLPFFREIDTLRLHWGRVGGAASYRVAMTNSFIFQGQRFLSGFSQVFADTSVNLAGTGSNFDGEDFFPRNSEVDVVVLAVDDNYYTYYRTSTDPFAGAPASRLTGGAVGVFGSIVPIQWHRLTVR